MSQRNIDVSVSTPMNERTCTVLEVLSRVSGKWSIGILLAASPGPIRFTELERTVPGISRRMLTLTLRNLERDGLLARRVYPTVPPRVEYTATEMARELNETLQSLADWAQRHRQRIAAARDVYDGVHGSPGADAGELSPEVLDQAGHAVAMTR